MINGGTRNGILKKVISKMRSCKNIFLKSIREYFAPRDFVWKVRRRIKKDRNPLFPLFVDKYKVREFAAQKGVLSVPLIYATSQPETIPFDSLPQRCFLKANHGSGWNLLYEKGRIYRFGDGAAFFGSVASLNVLPDSMEISRSEAIELMKEWLHTNYLECEWAYNVIKPMIVVEQMLDVENIDQNFDYRFYTFAGVVRCINLGSPCYRRMGINIFLDCDWNVIPLTSYIEKLPDPLPEKPLQLSEMIRIAEKIGQGTDFIRVDLYNTPSGIFLGEITVYPQGGQPNTPTSCPLFNQWLGDQWKQTIHRR